MTLLAIALALSFAEEPKVEVVSIKPAPRDERTIHYDGRTVRAITTLRGQIQWAYRAEDMRLDGLPKWVDQQAWDINVKGEDPTPLTEDQARRLLSTAIADRFHLKFHRIVEETSVYVLLVDKSGAKLKPSAPDATRDEKIFKDHLTATKYDIPRLAHHLHQELDRRVIDLTGLTGRYDVELEWAPEQTTGGDSSSPSIFSALKTQLGLRLELRKNYPIEFLALPNMGIE